MFHHPDDFDNGWLLVKYWHKEKNNKVVKSLHRQKTDTAGLIDAN
jgi:hypothetical protein